MALIGFDASPPRDVLLLTRLIARGSGEITPTEASEIGKLVDSYVRAVEATELAARIERLERMASQ